MPVESPADRASMFNTDEFAVAGLYTPPGDVLGVPCRVIHDPTRPEDYEVEMSQRSGMRAAIARSRATVLADDIPEMEAQGTLAVGAIVAGVFVESARYTIVSRPRQDETAAYWVVELQAVA